MITLEYPNGRPFVPAMRLRRRRPLEPGAIASVQVGEQVRSDQPLAMPTESQRGAPTLAGLSGVVTEVSPGQGITIEGIGSALYGVFGIGGSVAGPLVTLPRGESLAVAPMPRGAIILYPQQAPLMLFQRAMAGGVAGIIAGSAAAREMESFVRADLTALLDGVATDTPIPPLTVLLTEGFGNAPMNALAYEALGRHLGEVILLTGMTAPRHGVRPEVLLNLSAGVEPVPTPLDPSLMVGARVSVAQGELRGARGEVIYIFNRLQFSDAGLLSSCATVRLEDGSMRVILLSALDRIG